ncbi:MAG: pirin family protein, partial [Bacteroidetes bacterium]|nr:pirin family protein [Bacteroidota bacterium]
FPKERNIEPRYDQRVFTEEEKKGKFKTIVSPIKADDVMWINQDAYFSLGKFKAEASVDYTIQQKGNGAYIFIIEGEATFAGQKLEKRDAIGIWENDKIIIDINTDAEILIIDVPMN